MQNHSYPRLIIELAERCWVVSFPDEPEITTVTEGAIPLPFTQHMSRESVVLAMCERFPHHQIWLQTINTPIHNTVLSHFPPLFHAEQLRQPWSMSVNETEMDPDMVLPSWDIAIQIANYATGPHLGGCSDVYLHPAPSAVVTCRSLSDWLALDLEGNKQ